MTIEQKAELNRFVDRSIPLTWKWRWRQIKTTLPIWLFILAWLVEVWLFRAWLSNDWHWDSPLVVFGGWLAIILFVLGVAESQVRIEHRSKRLIKFQEKKIILKPCKSDSLPWKKPAKFQLEPIPEMSRYDEVENISSWLSESETIRAGVLANGAGKPGASTGVDPVPANPENRNPHQL